MKFAIATLAALIPAALMASAMASAVVPTLSTIARHL